MEKRQKVWGHYKADNIHLKGANCHLVREPCEEEWPMRKRNGGQCLRTKVLGTFFHYSQFGREQMADTGKNRRARGGNGMDSFVF
jgi:hypothetical protein